MDLTPGTQVGPYRVVAKLGAGGMGEVYQAHDPRLDREIALKFLRRAGAVDPERRRRFVQEARAASAIDHPNPLISRKAGLPTALEHVLTRALRKDPSDAFSRLPTSVLRS